MKTNEPKTSAQEAVELASQRRNELARRRQELTKRRGELARAVLVNNDEAKREELQRVIVELNALGVEEEVLGQVAVEAQRDWEVERDEGAVADLYAALDEAEKMLEQFREAAEVTEQLFKLAFESQSVLDDTARCIRQRLYRVSQNSGGVASEPIRDEQTAGLGVPGNKEALESVIRFARRRIAGLRSDLKAGRLGPKGKRAA